MADGPPLTPWPVEEIPDGDALFYRIHKNWMRAGDVLPGVFRNQGGAMSTDWSRYSTAAQSRNRAKVPDDNGIVTFIAGDLRSKANQKVLHSPDHERNNRAHADVLGDKDEEARLLMCRLMRWSLKPGVSS